MKLKGYLEKVTLDPKLQELLKDSNSLQYRILCYLPVGHENTISATRLSQECDVSEKVLRLAILRMNKDGAVICSCNDPTRRTGYYIPQEPQELLEGYLNRRSRAMGTLKGASAMRKLLLELGVDLSHRGG